MTCVNLEKDAVILPEDSLTRSLPWHARTEHFLPGEKNPAQEYLNRIFHLANEVNMVVNEKKTKTIIFNRSRNIDIEPNLVAPDGKIIEYVDKAKLLGVVINSKMNTWDNTENIEKKAYKRMWILKRLASLGCSKEDLTMTYIRQIRSVCEFAAPYWGPMMTKDESRRLERIQHTALHIILEESYVKYESALLSASLDRLDTRREMLITRFALQTVKNPKFQNWFEKTVSPKRHRDANSQYGKKFSQGLRDIKNQRSHI